MYLFQDTFGGIQQLRGQNFAIFWSPTTLLRGQFLYPERGQKQTFFDPSPLILSTLLLNGPFPQWINHHEFLITNYDSIQQYAEIP